MSFLRTMNVTVEELEVRSLYSSFSHLISFWIHTSLRISIGSANKQEQTMSVSFSHVPHAVYIFAKLTFRLSLQFSSVLLWAST